MSSITLPVTNETELSEADAAERAAMDQAVNPAATSLFPVAGTAAGGTGVPADLDTGYPSVGDSEMSQVIDDDGNTTIALFNSPGTPTPEVSWSFGGPELGGEATYEGHSGTDRPSDDGASKVDATVFDNVGHGRLETLTLHAFESKAGATIEPGESTYQPDGTSSALIDADLVNGNDGNNIESVFVDSVVGLNAEWHNGDPNEVSQPAVATDLVNADVLYGATPGYLESLTVSGPGVDQQTLYAADGPGLGNIAGVEADDLLAGALIAEGSSLQSTPLAWGGELISVPSAIDLAQLPPLDLVSLESDI